MMLYAIGTLVHGWPLMCLSSSLVFPTGVLVYRGFAMLSVLVCVLAVMVCLSATTHGLGLGGFTTVVHGLSRQLPCWSSVHLLFLNFQLVLRCLFALAEASTLLVPKSLDLACDSFFVFSSTFVILNCLHMCRKFAAGLCTVCAITFSRCTRGHRHEICAKRFVDI
jgi:hypothetical protein